MYGFNETPYLLSCLPTTAELIWPQSPTEDILNAVQILGIARVTSGVEGINSHQAATRQQQLQKCRCMTRDTRASIHPCLPLWLSDGRYLITYQVLIAGIIIRRSSCVKGTLVSHLSYHNSWHPNKPKSLHGLESSRSATFWALRPGI